MKTTEITESPEQTLQLGKKLGAQARPGDVYALTGDLGSGKTLLTKGIAQGMGITEDITSPTFALMETYENRIPLYHFDLYRIVTEDEFDNLFFEDYWEGRGLSVIEWPEAACSRLPEKTIHITLEYASETSRSITIEYPDN